ncbi:MAG: pyrroline-5-carboxylate reductase [Victivallales bacterium]|nr:pyrroline-5-carboxylate reductase [Victivallales bacterium]
MNIAFIGAGKMATAIVKGMLAAGSPFKKHEIIASDVSEESAKLFTYKTGIPCAATPRECVEKADFVLLAVKPQSISDAIAEISGAAAGKPLISIAAGVTLKTLMEGFETDRVIRVMPNTPLMIGEGASVLAASPNATENDKKTALAIFAASGITYELDESLIDAVTAVSGSGPAYFFEMIDAMAEAGTKAGLPAEIAMELTIQTACGAAGMLKAKNGTPHELRDAVTSPGGTTAAALATMEKNNFRGLLNDAVEAAKNRSIELGAAKKS